jgi:hypothetical protein
MSWRRLRLYAAGLVAFLIGIPLSEPALAQTEDIIGASFNLVDAIAESAGRS